MVWVLLEKKADLGLIGKKKKKRDMKIIRFQIIERERGLICNKRKPMTSKLSQVQCATKKTKKTTFLNNLELN
jgi:hypothetical protein